MIAVSIDRAILIYLSRPLTRNQAWCVCVGIWVLSYTITIPTLIHSKVHNQNKYKEQVISRHRNILLAGFRLNSQIFEIFWITEKFYKGSKMRSVDEFWGRRRILEPRYALFCPTLKFRDFKSRYLGSRTRLRSQNSSVGHFWSQIKWS